MLVFTEGIIENLERSTDDTSDYILRAMKAYANAIQRFYGTPANLEHPYLLSGHNMKGRIFFTKELKSKLNQPFTLKQ